MTTPTTMHIAFPVHFADGRLATVGDERHVRDLVEQLLFTSPGERVNRPDFGSGLLQTVFEPNGIEFAAALQVNVQGGLQRWLGDVIDVDNLEVTAQDERLHVTIEYVIRRTGVRRTETFEKALGQ